MLVSFVMLCLTEEKKTSESHFYCHCPQDHDGHGPEFLKHMQRINAESGANITVSIFFNDPHLAEVGMFHQYSTNISLCLDLGGMN